MLEKKITPPQLNILGKPLQICSLDPLTGYFRDGCCNTDSRDRGTHTVCVVVDEAFLTFSASAGNDLTTPRPDMRFPGLKPGDRWCLCAKRWKQALDEGCAPPVDLEATHRKTLDIVELSVLEMHAL